MRLATVAHEDGTRTLYVDGAPAVVRESYAVVEGVVAALRDAASVGCHSEVADVAATIRRARSRTTGG